MRVRVTRIAASAAFVVATMIGSSGIAAAAPFPTPNGWVGACNMNSSWPTLSPGQAVGISGTVDWDGDGGGMEHAMTVNNPSGNDGMFNAVFVSGNQAC
jgi:hypothetical protein